jgi:hypothetical protein
MALEFQVDSLDGLPEEVREHYVERNGKFEVVVNGMKTQGDVDRVMLSLRKEREEHDGTKAKLRGYGEFTPETVEQTLAELEDTKLQLAAIKKEGGPADEDIEKLVESRTQQRVKPVERKLGQLTTQLEELTGVNRSLIEEKTRGSILGDVLADARLKEVGVDPDALEPGGDVELWAERVFERTEDGKTISKEGVGVTPGLSPKEVLTDLKASGQRRHWFGSTHGAGAKGNKGGGGKDEHNPFKEGSGFNLTKAAEIIRDDPERAARLAKAAGREDLLPK